MLEHFAIHCALIVSPHFINICDKDLEPIQLEDLAVLSLNLACGVCYSNYVQFEGFEPKTQEKVNTSKWQHVRFHGNTTVKPKLVNAIVNEKINSTVTIKRKEINISSNNFQKHKYNLTTPEGKINEKEFKVKCPENEEMLSIGSYVLPTRRDLLLFAQKTLLMKFNSYHEKALGLLKDIKEATRATVLVEKKCHGIGKRLYKQCVQQVYKKCVSITKDSLQTFERQKAEIIALSEDQICNLTSMNINPIEQIKILATDEAVLEFAFQAFLRLLGECTVHCNNEPPSPDHRPMLREEMTQDVENFV